MLMKASDSNPHPLYVTVSKKNKHYVKQLTHFVDQSKRKNCLRAAIDATKVELCLNKHQ